MEGEGLISVSTILADEDANCKPVSFNVVMPSFCC